MLSQDDLAAVVGDEAVGIESIGAGDGAVVNVFNTVRFNAVDRGSEALTVGRAAVSSNRRGELGLGSSELPQLEDFAWLGPRRARRKFRHARIVPDTVDTIAGRS